MARRTKTVTIEGTPALRPADEGYNRDTGKVFVIREMAAAQAEAWAIRCLLVLTKNGAQVPDAKTGMAGMAQAGLAALSSLTFEEAKPLLEEMFTCVMYQHNPKHPLQEIDEGDASQIEEVSTRLELRKAVLALHTGFFKAGNTQTTG